MWCALVVLASLICSHQSLSLARGQTTGTPSVATSQSVLDPGSSMLLQWSVDYSTRLVTFRLQLAADAPAFNWLAIGFSDRGELTVTDVCLLWTDYVGREHFEDMHGDEVGKLHRDESQDCENLKIDRRDRTITYQRYFDTCDDDDYIIEDGTTHVIWARGTDKLYSSNGLCLSCAEDKDKGFIRVRLLTQPALPKPPSKELRFTNKNLKVPSKDTTYWCKVFKVPSWLMKKVHHIVQFESSITKDNEGLVHHMELFYCDAGDAAMPLYDGDCFDKQRPATTSACSKVKAAWAMGAPPFSYPEAAGLPFGGPQANHYVMLEVHYNNPGLKDDWVDSSGIVVHVTSRLRRYDAAIMELGLEYSDKMAIPGQQYAFSLTGHCVPECTGVGLPASGITVFGSQLHTHLTGVAAWTRHIRGGTELPALNRDMHYSTHFQEIRVLHKSVRVMPGDYLQTTCVYRTLDRELATVGGHAITDEMCVNYLHYYPATRLEVCKSAVSNKALENYFAFEKRWDNMSISFTSPPRANYEAIKPWSDLRVEALNQLYTDSPLSMQCNRSDGKRFQGEWEGIPIPRTILPLPPQPRLCPEKTRLLT